MPSETQIHHFAIHELIKVEGGFDTRPVNPEHDVTDTVEWLVDELTNLYAKRASKAYGIFSEDDANLPTQGYLRSYLDAGAADFAGFTQNMMSTLAFQARKKSAAAGGFVFFAHYTRDDAVFLMVAIVTNKLGASLTASTLNRIVHLDVEGFRFAGRININGWVANEKRYISFLKGKGDVAEYFQEFLGCDTSVQAVVDTRTLVRVIEDFASDKGMTAEEKLDFLRRAKSIGDDLARRGAQIDFQAFANELYPTEPEALVERLADPELALGDGFVPDRRVLKTLVTFRAKTALWSIEFQREAIARGAIRFDRQNSTLVIAQLPDELLAELRDEVAENDELADV